MTAEFLRRCIPLWDEFEAQLKRQYMELIQSGSLNTVNRLDRGASKIYWDLGFQYWNRGSGAQWVEQFDECFFESRNSSLTWQLDHFETLDACLEDKIKNLPPRIVKNLASPVGLVRKIAEKKCYDLIFAPELEKRRQEILRQLRELEAVLSLPVPCVLTLFPEKDALMIPLEFQSQVRKSSHGGGGMEGFTYNYNGRSYTDISSLWVKNEEELADDVFLGKDAYGEGVLQIYTSIPTFDSADREWGSHVRDFLMFDGKNIHLVKMVGGYRMASLTFYEHLLSADERLKPYFEKLHWPAEGICWKEA